MWLKSAKQFLGLALLALAWTGLASHFSPPAAQSTRSITLLEARAHDKAMWLDARNPEEYAAGHIPGAINLPLREALKGNFPRPVLSAGSDIIVYCDGPGCGASEKVAEILQRSIQGNVTVLPGGFPEWKNSGSAIKTGSEP